MGFVFVAAHDEDLLGLLRQTVEGTVNNLLYFGSKHFVGFKVLKCKDATGEFPGVYPGYLVGDILMKLAVAEVVNAFMLDGGQYISRYVSVGRQAVFVFPIVHHGFNDKVFGNGFIVHIGTCKVDKALLIVNEELIESFQVYCH